MSFFECMGIIKVLSSVETGMTVGQIMKQLHRMPRSRAEKYLNQLRGRGMVVCEYVPYRPNISKKLYTLTPNCIAEFQAIVDTYNEANHQLTFLEGAE